VYLEGEAKISAETSFRLPVLTRLIPMLHYGQEIRDCFSPIYNDGTGSEDNTASSNSNDDNDDETDSTDETDNTEGDTTKGSDGTDTSAGDDTTIENPDSTDSTDNNTQ
jgi:hypothetical protein